MSLIVQKFGGSSVADSDRVKNVAGIIARTVREGHSVIVILSAQGDTTDLLLEKAAEINARPSKREMDVLLSTGEQASVALMAMCLESMGVPAISLTGWQIGMKTNSKYSNAHIKEITGERIHKELDMGRVVLVAGFQGINKYEDITTLGRGGSDTTAVAIAAAMHADKCQIYTDVEGVYTADPRKVTGALKLDEITYDEMLELATLGAQVLHNRSVQLAKKYNVELEVLSSFTGRPGTIVREVVKMEGTKISGIAKDSDIARIAVVGLRDQPGIAFKVFNIIGRANINIDVILQSIGRGGTKDISFTVSKGDWEEARRVLENYKDSIGYDHIDVHTDVAKVSIVGTGMISTPSVAAMMFEALYNTEVNINMISTSEIKVSVLVDSRDADKAVNAIHDKFFGTE